MPANAGLPILLIGALLWTWQLRRLARANALSRLPWFDWPRVVPRGARQLTGVGLGAIGFGGVLLVGSVRDAVGGVLLAVPLLAVVVAVVLVIAVHNARLPRRLR